MAKALTVKALEKVQPGPSRREIPDGLLAGLYLGVQPSGAMAWCLRYRLGGRTRKWTIGHYPGIGLKDARELASKGLRQIAEGIDPGAEKIKARAAPPTRPDRDLVEKVVATFVERYAKANQKASTAAETERLLTREITAPWKGRHLSEIGKADVHELLDAIIDRGSAITANRAFAALRRMCAWAVERDIIQKSPCDGIKPPTPERSRDRILSDDELRHAWQACDEIGWPFGPLVQLLILTGQRREEVAAMRWAEIDLEGRTWTLPRERAKNDQANVIHLSATALAILKALPRIGGKGGFVFSTNGETSVSGFARAKSRIDEAMLAALRTDAAEPEKIELPHWVLHDLRRTFASGCARLGVNLPVIERILNHVSGSFGGIVGVYQRHSFADEKKAALDAWGEFVGKLAAVGSHA